MSAFIIDAWITELILEAAARLEMIGVKSCKTNLCLYFCFKKSNTMKLILDFTMHISTISTSPSVLPAFVHFANCTVSTRVKRRASLLGLACLLAASGLASQARAAEGDDALRKPQPIVVNLKQFKVMLNAKGESRLGDASLVLPGDVIEYQATYSNRSTSVLTVTATLPVPEAVEYIKDSAKSKPSLSHSVAQKDSLFAQEPLVKKVTSVGGTTVSQPVPLADYRFVRWDLGKLLPNTSVEVSIRAKVAQSLESEAATIAK